MDLVQLASVIGGFIGIILLAVTWAYIDKLEKIGCACAAHPYQRFVKVYPAVAIVYLLLTMFIPPSMAVRTFGPMAGSVLMLLKVVYAVATLIFFVIALMYVRYLKAVKCACSEDVRREVLYWWAIIEIVILASLVVFGILFYVLGGAFALAMGTAGKVAGASDTIRESAVNPLKSARKVPAALKKTLKSMRS